MPTLQGGVAPILDPLCTGTPAVVVLRSAPAPLGAFRQLTSSKILKTLNPEPASLLKSFLPELTLTRFAVRFPSGARLPRPSPKRRPANFRHQGPSPREAWNPRQSTHSAPRSNHAFRQDNPRGTDAQSPFSVAPSVRTSLEAVSPRLIATENTSQI